MNSHELNHFFQDDMDWCACGMPDAAARLVLELLRACPFYDNRLRVEQLLPCRGVEYFVLYGLASADLIEHGGSVGGSWLTEKGKEVLASLEEISKTDPELGSIFPDCTEAPPETCAKCYPRLSGASAGPAKEGA
jgi:hypothetical protein